MKVVEFEPGDFTISIQKLQEIKARLALTSSGPWIYIPRTEESTGNPLAEVASVKNGSIAECQRVGLFEGAHAYFDADLFCHAKEDIELLLNQVESLLSLFNKAVPARNDSGQGQFS